MSGLSTQFKNLSEEFLTTYKSTTPRKIQLIDMFLLFSLCMGILLAVYTVVSGMYPYNSFLASFISYVGFFVLTVCLRLQISKPKDFGMISAEKSFASYVFCNILLFFVVTTYMG